MAGHEQDKGVDIDEADTLRKGFRASTKTLGDRCRQKIVARRVRSGDGGE